VNPVTAPSDELREAAHHAFELGEGVDWRSHDPFDLLLSPYARLLTRSPLAARMWIQVGRRTGRRTRRVLGVPEHREAKALADFVSAAVILSRRDDGSYLDTAERLAGLLEESSVESYTGRGWGLSFDYVSRFGRIDANTPNAYTTISAAEALLDWGDRTGVGPVSAAVTGARAFLLGDLRGLAYNDALWFRYTSRGAAPIVNIQASAAAFFARLAWSYGDTEAEAIAHAAAETTIAAQRPDGSWPYSVDGRAEFVDGFHTGFTLQGLHGYLSHAGARAVSGTDETIAHGFDYFLAHLMTADGLPRGFADGAVTMDAPNAAQCVQTLLSCGGESQIDRALDVWRAAVSRHLSPRREELLSLRWNLAPAVLATTIALDRCMRRQSIADSAVGNGAQ
jgi:hypothetical protein